MGDEMLTLDLAQEGIRLPGRLSALGNKVGFEDDKVDGNVFSRHQTAGRGGQDARTIEGGKLVSRAKVLLTFTGFVVTCV
ncbi:hypothetical protein [Raoultibacter timonensis]|uniref:hypothetical protein n=1 Tax=Raoultibacter timonensis TaxID=1907662 RepID=UPI000C843EDE|nr:hypothetical protein [Raoultibacter timonensis]